MRHEKTSPRRPYLIQRIKEQRYASPMATGMDAAFCWDYMGSAEFEFGALGNALARMRVRSEPYAVCKVKSGEHTLWAVALAKSMPMVQAFVDDQLGEESWRFKERPRLRDTVAPESASYPADYVGWWALDVVEPWVVFVRREDAERWLDVQGRPGSKS